MDDYSKYPKSIGERRADDDGGNAAKWSPRDAVIAFLRELDAGNIRADTVVIAYSVDDGGGHTTTGWRMAGPSVIQSLGTLTYVQQRIVTGAHDD